LGHKIFHLSYEKEKKREKVLLNLLYREKGKGGGGKVGAEKGGRKKKGGKRKETYRFIFSFPEREKLMKGGGGRGRVHPFQR